jgi:hypothetical protein
MLREVRRGKTQLDAVRDHEPMKIPLVSAKRDARSRAKAAAFNGSA